MSDLFLFSGIFYFISNIAYASWAFKRDRDQLNINIRHLEIHEEQDRRQLVSMLEEKAGRLAANKPSESREAENE